MNEAYKNMRAFWLDPSNLIHKKGVQGVGEFQICNAGLEFCMKDHEGKLKNIFVAASVLGDASMYFENNSPSGLGGFLGGHDRQIVTDLTKNLVDEAAASVRELHEALLLPEPTDPAEVTLFALSKEKLYLKTLKEEQARDPKNPLHKFFAYTQQLIGAFRDTTQK